MCPASEGLHDRARFEVFPYAVQNPVLPKVLQIIWDWN